MLLPRALKGADLVLYSVFKSLGIKIEVVPVIQEDDFRKGHYDMDEEYESLEYDSNPKDSKGKKEDDVNDKREQPQPEMEYSAFTLPMNIDRYWKKALLSCRLKGPLQGF